MASRREKQQESARLGVMRLLSDNPEISTRALADAVGISNGSAYYVLKALVDKGFVKLESFRNSSRKRNYSYLLTPKGMSEKSLLTHDFITRKRLEYDALSIEIKILEEEVNLQPRTQAQKS